MSKVVLLLSGGQDSATCLWVAKRSFDDVYPVSFFYGQSHGNELRAAKRVVDLAREDDNGGAVHRTLELEVSALRSIGGSALTENGDTSAVREDGLPATFVPARNAVFLSLAAAYASKVGAETLMTGVCQTDYSGYPDCREAFILAQEQALSLALGKRMRILAPLMHLTKADTVRLMLDFGPLAWRALGETVTCYRGVSCGTCPACVLRAKGFAEAGYDDPSR